MMRQSARLLALPEPAERVLHDPILERVKRDDGEAAPLAVQGGNGRPAAANAAMSAG